MASLSAFIDVLKREIFTASKKTPLKTLVTILVIFVLEKVLTAANIFQCPKEGYHIYGGMFLFVPAFCLVGLTLLTSNSFWDSATSGLRGESKYKIIWSNVCHSLAGALLMGTAWLVLALGTTDYYVCFRVGASKADCPRGDEIKAQSTILALAMLVGIICLSLLYLALQKCCFPNHKRECSIHSLRDYERLETEAAFSKFDEEIKLLAEKQGEKQVMKILDEAQHDSNVQDVVRKAKSMLLEKYARLTRCEQNENDPDETCLLRTADERENIMPISNV
ncbi:uncharacterized protein LOC114523016 [Dendronephthya gigantea]|uniref:uncharacterized protein LOC114523016 n=1 Tax=Dendronephthya gigantea TaxID=151771 RepID=UPI00106D4292|nr:uncharacterized protein LOC114523016 [Dendronephthya gigantea]